MWNDRAPLGWDNTDHEPTARAVVCAAVRLLPGDDRRDRPRRRRLPRDGCLDLDVDPSPARPGSRPGAALSGFVTCLTCRRSGGDRRTHGREPRHRSARAHGDRLGVDVQTAWLIVELDGHEPIRSRCGSTCVVGDGYGTEIDSLNGVRYNQAVVDQRRPRPRLEQLHASSDVRSAAGSKPTARHRGRGDLDAGGDAPAPLTVHRHASGQWVHSATSQRSASGRLPRRSGR